VYNASPMTLFGMSSTDSAPADWYLESLRLTAFRVHPIADERDEWMRFVGAEPEVEIRSRAEGATAYISAMPHELGTLTLQVDGTRRKADWFVGAVRLHDVPPALPIVGPLADVLPQLRSFVSDWCARNEDSSRRVAVGLVLLGPDYQDRASGYDSLQPFLPAVHLDGQSSDFMYRINRQRPSQVAATLVNRVSLWSVVRMLDVELGSAAMPVNKAEQYRRRVALDINTAQEQDAEFDASMQSRLIHELLDLGLEISEKGDIP